MADRYEVAELGFNLSELIGRGGCGEVFKAHDPQLNAVLAIKKIPLNRFSNPDLYFEESKKLFLSRHHNVVPIQYACKNDGFLYIAMPYYRNGSVYKLMERRFLTCKEILRYSLQFLSGLNNIHVKGLIHFDVKPENFLRSDSDHVMLVDFGVAQHTGTYGFARVGETTELFAPPEFFSQGEHNLKFDIYQAGLAMYRMCVGDERFNAQARAVASNGGNTDRQMFIDALNNGRFPDRKLFLPHIHKRIRKVINKAISVDPGERYSSVIDMLNDLNQIEEVNVWSYEELGENRQRWSKSGYEVIAEKSGNGWAISASKNGRRNMAFCGADFNETTKEKVLYKCLNESW